MTGVHVGVHGLEQQQAETGVLNVRAQLILFALLVIFSRLGLEGVGGVGCPMLPPDMLPPSGS